ncbi:MAG: VWA domain-containing protein [Deltaproteobacteria bacterium]|jgi:Ca-activated chloride channel family protein|nr:VWA domain-containing protein [Deltaproteobacteria bacterium]
MELLEVMNLKNFVGALVFSTVLFFLLFQPLFFPRAALAQIVLAPPPRVYDRGFEALSLELTIDVSDQRAKVHLRQTIKNTGNRNLELDYLVPLPSNGAVSGLSLVANGKELSGEIHGKDEAFKIYQDIVSKLKDPALLEFAGLGLFRVRAFPVAKGKSASLDLTMDYLLPKDNGQVELDFPLANSLTQGLAVGSQIVSVRVKGQKIGGVFSLLDNVNVTKTAEGARADLSLKNSQALSKFQLYYREESGPMGGVILSHKPQKSEAGFFLFMAEPVEIDHKRERLPKNVIFALDTSGSMAGAKFRQAQDALKFVLDRLEPEDRFNLISFDSQVLVWKTELTQMTQNNRTEAKSYVDALFAEGGTNIEEALNQSLSLNVGKDPTYLIFLTDGDATVGEENDFSLARLAAKANEGKDVRIFSFGVGHDVNARLLERLSGDSSGFSTYVHPDENIEQKVASFFSKISDPMLVKPQLKSSLAINRVLPERLPDVFKGSQLVVVGRYPEAGKVSFTLTGTQDQDAVVTNYPSKFADGPTENGRQIALIWAQRRVGQLIDEIDQKGQGHPDSDQLNELVELSKEFGIMTPYTSFLALEDQALTDTENILSRTELNLSKLGDVSGDMAIRQREYKSDLSTMSAQETLTSAALSQKCLDYSAILDPMIDRHSRLIAPTMLDGQAFFQKEGRLVPGDVSEDDLKNLTVIKKFSQQYFDLAKKLSQGQMAFLTQAVPLVFKFEGQNFLIDVD